MPLAEPLGQEQVNAACRFHQLLPQWHLSDVALQRLHLSVPGFDEDACLLKAVAVNSLYGTQVYAIIPMARHICRTMGQVSCAIAGIELVEALARLDVGAAEKVRIRTSFAAKFCHFFVDEDRFPVYDEAARKVLKLHLGRAYLEDEARPYLAFTENLKRLRTEANLVCTGRELDRYLWIAGMYDKWTRESRKAKPVMNAELRKTFEHPTDDAKRELRALLPATLVGSTN